ncbi:MAG: redoxin domain-containing protein [Verrucomicrobiales bacterium]|nr:redoxin domain-containing protein [Verrucomicrobiales bacterium]
MFRSQIYIASLLLLMFVASAKDQTGVPDLEVTAPVDGAVFRLSEARGRYVALHFLLKTECPFCQRHVREYVQRAAELPDVVQVFLKPDSEEEIRRWVARSGMDTTNKVAIYRDPNARWAKAFRIPFGYEFHGELVHYPALLIIDKKNHEAFRHVGQTNADRYRFAQLMNKISELKVAESLP